jgi:hypothetical protein
MLESENLYLQLNVIARDSDNDKWTFKSVAGSGTVVICIAVSIFAWVASAE